MSNAIRRFNLYDPAIDGNYDGSLSNPRRTFQWMKWIYSSLTLEHRQILLSDMIAPVIPVLDAQIRTLTEATNTFMQYKVRYIANRDLPPHTQEENEEYKHVSTFRADLSEQRKEAATLVKTVSETSIATKNLIYESTDSVRTIMQGFASHADGQIVQVRLTLRAVASQFGGNPSSVRDSIDTDF